MRRVDVVVAVVFLATALVEELTAPHQLSWWWARLALATLLVLVRRAAPLGTMVVDIVVLQTLLMPMSVDNYRVWQAFCMLIGMHTIGREIILRGPDRDPAWRRAAALVVVAGSVVYLVLQDLAMLSDYFATVGYLFAAWVSGLLLQFQARRIAERNAAVAAAEALRAREALADERARIARELHDIVAHSVTVMVLQTSVVRRRLSQSQEPERHLLTAVEDAGREAVTELRRTLGLLRGAASPELAPQPGLSRLDDLVDQLRASGLVVRVRVAGTPLMLAPSLDLSAYRILQESLTNVLKHSGTDRAEVTISYRPDAVSLSVVDPGGRASPPSAARPLGVGGGHVAGAGVGAGVGTGTAVGAGHGIVGMRERAAMFGGTLEAAPQSGGGFRVTANLPIPARADYTPPPALTDDTLSTEPTPPGDRDGGPAPASPAKDALADPDPDTWSDARPDTEAGAGAVGVGEVDRTRGPAAVGKRTGTR